MTGYNPDQQPKCRLTQSAFRDDRWKPFFSNQLSDFVHARVRGTGPQQTQQGKLDKRPGGEYIALVPRSGIFLSVIFSL